MDCGVIEEAETRDNQKPPVFKVYDDGYIVRGMTFEDAKIVQKWYSGEGICSEYDLNVALMSFPPGIGFYVGEYKGVVVSSAVRLPWGNGVYYGSYYYVHEKYRSRGFRTRLRDEVAFGHVGDNILCVDAVMGSVSEKNAAKFRYVEAFVTRRFVAEAKSRYGVEYSGKIIKANEVSFQDLIDFDNKNFVSKDNPVRKRFLESWINLPKGASYVAVDASGSIVGFGNIQPAMDCQPKNHLIGPLYADTPEVAEVLLQRLCQDVVGENVTVNVWTPNEDCLEVMESFGFTTVFDVLRMHVNGDPKEFKNIVYCPTNIDTCGF